MPSKLYYRYSTVSSGKTARLAIEVHNDRLAGRRVLVLKIGIDTRWGATRISSRVPGLELEADAVVHFPGDILRAVRKSQPDFIYVDEIQFSTRDQVEMFRDIATFENIPVICYGLNSSWQIELFEGSSAMFALADEVEHIKSICSAWGKCCTRRALINVKHRDRKPVAEGPQVELGAEESYIGMCYQHYDEFIHQ
jgi:thymidine kinase